MYPRHAHDAIDILDYLASGMTPDKILADFPCPAAEDIQDCLAYVADHERHQIAFAACSCCATQISRRA